VTQSHEIDSNGLKYLISGNLWQPAPRHGHIATARPIGRPGITYAADVSSDLRLWVPGVQAAPPMSNGDGTETVIFRDTTPVPLAPARFMRLTVLQAQ
jgi:hypothetical protein